MSEQLQNSLPALLGIAWLLPLASFVLIVFIGPRMGKHGVLAGHVATGSIVGACFLSMIALISWLGEFGALPPGEPHEQHHSAASLPAPFHLASMRLTDTPAESHGAAGHSADSNHGEHAAAHETFVPKHCTGDWYVLGQFGKLKVTIGYYIDALTVCMFCMVTLIASCIHFYAIGYMHDELHEVTDHEVTLSDGHHLHRPGRFHRFFQYFSLFCFSMLGLVIAGNIAMVFVFWELVGICSYFLIGFYIERKSATNAGNKAFIVNRIGDFGMIIGLMALWGSLGTFAFGDIKDEEGVVQPGIFSQVRKPENHYALVTPDGMVKAAAGEKVAKILGEEKGDLVTAAARIQSELPKWRDGSDASDTTHYGYWLLVVAGVGIFCGCVGKSAQFPLHVWLPDAMEGPTPVSALVHSATMVAAGVYLVGRFYPVFAPEVLVTIAYTGAITLFLAATIAITATDIKRVLAYSTVSQLGYMMLALGVGGWAAGMFHLITHAFFKSLLFLCSGSVIHACHTNEMTKMGGLRHKMPWTAYTMLVGCLAIIGAAIPFVIGTSGYYSKDSIVAQALSFWQQPSGFNSNHGAVFFLAAAGGAAVTAFYMFRLWFMTFAGQPRDHHIYDHAHESPKIMYVPLVVLAVFAVGVGWNLPFTGLSVTNLLEQARPAGTLTTVHGGMFLTDVIYPDEHASHVGSVHVVATLTATATALSGFLLAVIFYGLAILSPAEVRQQFAPIYNFLLNKWYFDELYNLLFVRPTHWISGMIARFDKKGIDWFIDNLAVWTRAVANFDDLIDRYVVDGLVNLSAAWTYSFARSLRSVQTGKLRQYVMLIVIGTVALTILIKWSAAGIP